MDKKINLSEFADLYFRLMKLKKSVKEPLEKKMEKDEMKKEEMENKKEEAMYKKVEKLVKKKAKGK